jgi:zinc protease
MSDSPDTLLVEEHSRPITTTVTVLRTGTRSDPPGKEGLAYLTAEMLQRGAGDWSQAKLADEIEFLGSTLSVNVGRSTTTVTGDALTRNLDRYENIVQTLLTQPRFEPEEFQKLKRQTAADLVHVRENDNMLCQRFLVKDLYKEHPYGRPRKGTLGTLESIQLSDVKAFYQEHYHGSEALTAAAGDITNERLNQFALASVGQLPLREQSHEAPPPAPKLKGIETILVDKPDRTQIPVMMGHTTIHANHPNYLPLFVGNIVFGGTFTARLSQEIREKRGWSYGAYSSIHGDRNLGTFLMRFSPSVKDTLPAIELAISMMKDVVRDGVTLDELTSAKNYLCNSHAFGIDTSVKRLYELILQRLTGRPDDWLNSFVERVSNVTLDNVNSALAQHLDPASMVLSVVATADEFRPILDAWDGKGSLSQVDYRSE